MATKKDIEILRQEIRAELKAVEMRLLLSLSTVVAVLLAIFEFLL